MPSEKDDIKFDKLSDFRRSDYIPKNCIIALGQCIYYIISSDNISASFKNYILDIAFDLYFDLKHDSYSTALINSIKEGGNILSYKGDKSYVDQVIDAYDKIDKPKYTQKNTYEKRDKEIKQVLNI